MPKVVLALILAMMLVGLGTTLQALSADRRMIGSLSAQIRALQDSSAAHGLTIQSLDGRITASESDANSQIHPTDLAQATLGSVFTIVASSHAGTFLGSGFVVASSAATSTLVTNFHVVEDVWKDGYNDVKVRQGDQSYFGTIVRVSQEEDLAAITIPGQFPALALDQTLPAVGDPLVVIGSPYGLEGTVATGIVSAHRPNYIQFSAPVSPGDSGGPVLEANGSVVGVTVSKVAAHAAEGLSFAIPAQVVCATVITC